jgi:hypothetical protein
MFKKYFYDGDEERALDFLGDSQNEVKVWVQGITESSN